MLQLHVHVLFRNYKMDENSRPRKQARLDTFLIPHETRKVKGKLKSKFNQYFE